MDTGLRGYDDDVWLCPLAFRASVAVMETGGLILLGLGAWAAATLLPVSLALWFWNIAARRHSGWVAHVLFAPCLIAVEWMLVRLIFFAAGDDGSDALGLGLVVLPPVAVFIIALVGYYICLAYTTGLSLWRRLSIR